MSQPPNKLIDIHDLLVENNRLLEENIRLLKMQERHRKRQLFYRIAKLVILVAIFLYIYYEWIAPLQQDMQIIQGQISNVFNPPDRDWSEFLPF